MAVINNTFQTYQTKGIRESLSDIISNISPTETPISTNAGQGPNPKNTFYEWQTDILTAVNTANAQVEGDDISTFDPVVPTVRVGAHTQISRKTLIIADTQEEVTKAGRKSDWAYEIAKKGKEFKRDVEGMITANNGDSAGSASTARVSPTLLSYIQTNTDFGATGANPSAPAPTYAGTRTDGTLRTWTETILKSIISKGYASGMKVDGATLVLPPALKQETSAFAGIATKTFYQSAAKEAAIIGAADVYVSDFGVISIITDLFMRVRDGLLLDFDLIKFRDLRPYRTVDLAKTGDATKKLLVREWSLQVLNEAGLAGAFDLQ